MTTPVIVQPDATVGTWHDQAPAVAAEAAATLRLGSKDVDTARVYGKALPACALIDRYLDLRALPGRVTYVQGGLTTVTYATDDAPADVLEAAAVLCAELYRRKDATFGVLNAWSTSGEPLRISRDTMAGVESMLMAYREGFGVG